MTSDDDEAFSGDPLTPQENRATRRMLEADRFRIRFWTTTRTVALWIGAVATAITVGWPVLKDMFKFIGK